MLKTVFDYYVKKLMLDMQPSGKATTILM